MALGSPSHLQREPAAAPGPRRESCCGRTARGWPQLPELPPSPILPTAGPGKGLGSARCPALGGCGMQPGAAPADAAHPPWPLAVPPAAGDICSCFSLCLQLPGPEVLLQSFPGFREVKDFFPTVPIGLHLPQIASRRLAPRLAHPLAGMFPSCLHLFTHLPRILGACFGSALLGTPGWSTCGVGAPIKAGGSQQQLEPRLCPPVGLGWLQGCSGLPFPGQ